MRTFDRLVDDATALRLAAHLAGEEPDEYFDVTSAEFTTLAYAPAERARHVLSDRRDRLCGLVLRLI